MKLQYRVFNEVSDYSCAPPRRQCSVRNCHNDALSLSPFCDDCDTEMRFTRPDLWHDKLREFSET